MPDTTASKFASFTDAELIDAILSSQALENWLLQSAYPVQSREGVELLRNTCEELDELLSRDTAIASIRKESPALIETYLGSSDGLAVLRAYAMIELVNYLCPDMVETMKSIRENNMRTD